MEIGYENTLILELYSNVEHLHMRIRPLVVEHGETAGERSEPALCKS